MFHRKKNYFQDHYNDLGNNQNYFQDHKKLATIVVIYHFPTEI